MCTLITVQGQVINVHSNYCPGAGYKCALELLSRGRLYMWTLITIQGQVIHVYSNYYTGAGYKCAL